MKTKKIVALVAVVACGAMCFTGCRRPYDTPEYVTITASQTAFLVPLVGDSSNQASFESEEMLEQAKVATKEIQIPHRWVQTGRKSYTGEWRDSAVLIVVERKPVTREWVSSADNNNAIFGESLDGVGIYVGMNCSAQINESDATKFLYRYNNTPLATVIDTDIRALVEDEFNKAVGKYAIADLQEKKGEIMDEVISNVKDHFAEYGVTITVLGMKEGVTYENPKIQEAIDEKFSSEQLLVTQENMNAVEVAKAEAAAEAAKIEAEAEAEVLRIAADAEAEANLKVAASLTPELAEIRKIEAFVSKWNGEMPKVQSDGGTIIDMGEIAN